MSAEIAQMPADAAEPNEDGAAPKPRVMAGMLRIVGIAPAEDGSARIELEGDEYALVGPEWLAENRPYVGGYLADSGGFDPNAIKAELWFVPAPRQTYEAVRAEVAKLSLKQGDSLVVKLDKIPSSKQSQMIKDHLGPILPEGCPVVVTGPDVEFSVLAKEAPREPLGASDTPG